MSSSKQESARQYLKHMAHILEYFQADVGVWKDAGEQAERFIAKQLGLAHLYQYRRQIHIRKARSRINGGNIGVVENVVAFTIVVRLSPDPRGSLVTNKPSEVVKRAVQEKGGMRQGEIDPLH